METLQAIMTRRSCKQFRPDPVDRDRLETLLAAAVRAPNHFLTQPWHFHVVTGGARRRLAALRAEQMAAGGRAGAEKIARHVREIETVPALILVSAHAGRGPEEQRENYAATACAIMNMLLAAHAHGLGAIWRTGSLLAYGPLREWLGLTPAQELIGSVYVGYPDGAPAPPTPRAPWPEKTTWLAD